MELDAYIQWVTPHVPWLLTLALVFARAAGVLMVAPVFGERAVPRRLRALLAAAVALAVAGRLAGPVRVANGFELAGAVVCEVLLGAALGYALRLIFEGVQLAAVHVGQQMGVSLGAAYAPTADSSDPVRRFLGLCALVVFLAIGGHRVILAGLMRTFDAVPPASPWPAERVLHASVGVLGLSFSLALKLAAPVLIALLTATAALGLLQKTLPQCHVLSVGLPVRALLGMVALAAGLGLMAPLLDAAVSAATDRLIGALTIGG